jgi:hypothetical protein
MVGMAERWEIDYRDLGFWDRREVRNAVKRGRRVDDRALAPIAVGYARRVQERGAGWSWFLGDAVYGAVVILHAAIAAVFLPWYAVVPAAVFLLVLSGFRHQRAGADDVDARAAEAEEANSWIVENYELLDARTRSQLRPRRFRAVRRLVH